MEFQTAHDYAVGAMGSNEFNASPNSFADNVDTFNNRRRQTEDHRQESLLQVNSSGNRGQGELKGTVVSQGAMKTLKSTYYGKRATDTQMDDFIS